MKTTIKGVLIRPSKREKFGAEIILKDGIITSIKPNPQIKGPFIIPGFVDAHVHIESSMLIPSQFSKLAAKHGTIAVVADPHEVANVGGEEGIRFMIEDSKNAEIKFFFGVPSCVPASPLEKCANVIDSRDVERMIKEKEFYFLAEMMNFPGVIYDDEEVRKKLIAAKNAEKPIDGHAPGLKGEELKKYIESGISTDHECSTIEEAERKILLGQKIQIREGSAAKNFNSLAPLIRTHSDSLMFCTDDCHPDYLIGGHINRTVTRAVAEGYDVFEVLKIACNNPVSHYNLPVGQLNVGDSADFVIVEDLENFIIIDTYINGLKVTAKDKDVNYNSTNNYPKYDFRKTHTRGKLNVKAEKTQINVIKTIPGELITEWLVEDIKYNKNGEIEIDPHNDLLKIVLLDRYSESDPVIAFIKGIGLKEGAIAESVAHDSHHIIAVGADDLSIDNALSWIVDNGGGLCYAYREKVTGLELPYYGLMTAENGENVIEKYDELNRKVKSAGSNIESPFMTVSFMALTVIPSLKINHNGLFDGINFKSVPLFA
jgi:adenine deaminase